MPTSFLPPYNPNSEIAQEPTSLRTLLNKDSTDWAASGADQETRLSPPLQTGLGPAALLPKRTPRGAESNPHRAGHSGIAQVHVVYPEAEWRPAAAISVGQPAKTANKVHNASQARIDIWKGVMSPHNLRLLVDILLTANRE